MHVASVEGTVKGNVQAQLGRLTLIVGPNGSGKSRLINTLELALLGFASDVVGRPEMRKEADLVAMAEGDELLAKVTLSDGRVSQWGTAKTKTGAKRADHVKAVLAEFPVTDVRNALTGSVETARKWLLQRIAATVSRNDVKKYLTSDESEALYESKAKYIQGSEVDILLAVLESAKSEKRSKATQQTTTAKSISTMTEGLGVEPTEAQLATAKRNAEDAVASYRLAVEAKARIPVAPVVDTSLAARLYDRAVELASLLEFASRNLAEAQSDLASLGGPLTEDARQVQTLRANIAHVCEMQAQTEAPVCFVCEGAFPASAAAERAKNFKALNQNMTDREAATGALSDANEVMAKLQAEFEQAVGAYQAAKAQAEQAVPVATTSPEAAEALVQQAAQELRAANDLVAQMNQTAGAWKSVRSLRQEEREAKKAIVVLEELIEGCKAAVEGILKTATSAFIARVQSFLPPTDTFDLVLNDGEREVCRFGFVRGGSLHTALSGAEWARLTLALACATSTDSPDILRIFVPEDRAFDPQTLRNVLEALTEAPGQVIIATTIKPAGRMPKGWTLVETGGTE